MYSPNDKDLKDFEEWQAYRNNKHLSLSETPDRETKEILEVTKMIMREVDNFNANDMITQLENVLTDEEITHLIKNHIDKRDLDEDSTTKWTDVFKPEVIAACKELLISTSALMLFKMNELSHLNAYKELMC